MNSVGELSTVYLSNDSKFKAEAKFANAQEILAQYKKKESEKERTELVFQSYQGLKQMNFDLNQIKQFLEDGKYSKAEILSSKLIKLAIEGMRYYQTYDWLLLRTIVCLGYLGWIAYSLVFIFSSSSKTTLFPRRMYLLASIIIFATGGFLLYKKESPPSYYAYWFFPVVFWIRLLEKSQFIRSSLHSALSKKNRRILYHTIFYILTLEFLVSIVDRSHHIFIENC